MMMNLKENGRRELRISSLMTQRWITLLEISRVDVALMSL